MLERGAIFEYALGKKQRKVDRKKKSKVDSSFLPDICSTYQFLYPSGKYGHEWSEVGIYFSISVDRV